ncbi:MAG: hypothetical protein GOMPHAMPRED_005477 [Gomphillus americanus]|uniref:Uncharacterized protein n=1 Tax=Gomphillus americanus TaxID=1940652 RepID=A0A8H3FTK8_9LECA|nr:MAG: hypothetical protein GOMPHAMPRED_005477 [Gomphillus americanus]
MVLQDESKLLSTNDGAVLSQIFDPESAPSAGILVDTTLHEDPYYTDPVRWNVLKQREKAIVLQVETAMKNKEPLSCLRQIAADMRVLMDVFPLGACLLNDYAQIIRLQYGNDLLLNLHPEPLKEALQALDKAIDLLKPVSQGAVSPAQCRTLAQAYTQRGALFHGLASSLSKDPSQKLCISALAHLTIVDLQEAASRDFFMGGRYGNEVGRALAVHTNPTAKLCGQMVQNAMRKEFSSA